ncbi:MAG: hypothetical protein KBA06_05120, partial [Saprospiraceae bacterium]|nr:hypothetical protein [Saprospiraceae bacterium]
VYLLYVSIANHPKGNIFYAKRSKQEYYLNNIFWASIILLLFAHGFPFLIPGFEWMTDYLSGLRQFRSLGRFAWVFYYVINIVAFYKLYRWAVRIKKRSIGFVVLFIPLLNICLESGKFFNEFQSNMESAIDLKKYAVDHWSKHVDIGDYQAIMCLPAYHNGSENIWYGGMDGHTFAYSLVNSQITGLPLMSSYIGRASISQTLNQLQFIMEPTQSSLLVKDLKDERPILVWILKKNFENEKNEYKWIFENSEKIYANETDLLFRLNYLILNDYLKQKKHDIQKEIQNLSPNAEDRLITNDSAFNNVIFYDYDQNESSKQFLGSNCIEKPSNENYILFDNKIPNVDTSKVYDINFWCFVNKDRYATNLFRIKIYNENQELFKDEKSLFSNIKSIRDGWALISYKINFHDVNAKLSVSVGNENIRHEMMYIDNFMILPEKVDVYLQNDNYLMKNNLWYDK